ncbi:hypothetical protein ACQ4PT_038734 [Festuca glaucescens]
MKAAAKPKPPPPPAAATAQPSTKAASSSSSSAADPNTKCTLPAAADAAHSTPSHPNLNTNGPPNPSPLLPSPHAAHLQPPQPLPPPRPLLTVAAVDAAMAVMGPPPQYGLESLDRRTVTLSDSTVRTYFALPLEPPPQLRQPLPPISPVPHLGPPSPGPGPNRWIPPLMHAAAPPGPPPKRKWEGQSNGGGPGESSGRQQQQQQHKPVAKQVKVETPEFDAKTLRSSFLKMVRMINENTEVKKNYWANGKNYKCAVCNRDSVDLHALLNHSYNTKNPESRADHLGLHKAICVLMGWNYSVDPVHKKAYQTLSNADAEANRGDLILWPPTIIVENTYKSRNDGQKDAMSNREMESKLREMGFGGVTVKPLVGKDGAMAVRFESSLAGLKEAVRLAELFEAEGHGRLQWDQWVQTRGIPTSVYVGGSNPMFVKVDEKGQHTWVLYGYLGTASDLGVLDTESKQNVVIKSRKELDLSD